MPVKYHTKLSHGKHILRLLFVIGFLTFLVTVAVGSIFLLTLPLPNPNELKNRQITESTKIFDRTGKILLYEIYNEEKRTVIPFGEIPRNAKNATIAIEDSHFYTHAGISVFSIFRAFIVDLLHGQLFVQGGSTITQQLVKNTLLTSEKTLTRKLKEVVLALKIERIYSKDEILDMYLNEISYGSNTYGIEAAAQTFFGKNARDLTLSEAAYLAALPKAPSHYSPYGNNRNELVMRKNIVLKRMEELQFISPEEAANAHEEQVVFLPPSPQGIRAPHFVMHVIDILSKEFGDEYLRKNGLVIRTSLDMNLQQGAEDVIAAYRDTIEKNFKANNTGLVALDPKTGEILAMVGSRDYFNNKREGNFNITLARRQPGSAFKPIVYAASLEKGYTPQTVVFDVPTEFAAAGAESYQPQNYDNKFRGPVTFREALAQSLNVPSVKVLYLTGLQAALDMARRLGISTLAGPNQYGLTLVLGGGEVQLIELVSAYSVFANDGIQNNNTAILRVEKHNGEIVWEHKQTPKQVLEANIARTISDILSDNEARAPAFGSASALYFPDRPVAVKTGTTNDYKDAWIIGYTPNLAAGVWAGNNDNTPMEKRVAGFIVAPLWHEFMKRAFQTVPLEQFIPPIVPVQQKPILSGEWNTPEIHSILYWVDKNNPTGPSPDHPERDPQYENWESAVRTWADQKGLLSQKNITQGTTTKPHIFIQKPLTNDTFSPGATVTVQTQTESNYPITQKDYFLNGTYIGSNKTSSEIFVFTLPNTISSPARLTVKVYDAAGNTEESYIFIGITI